MERRRFRFSFVTGSINLCAILCITSGFAVVRGQEGKDTREGEDISLECRFPPQINSQTPTYFWLRTNKRKHDNVAVQDTPLESNYRIDFRPEQGKYDLMILNTSYDRDNGMFECRVKAAGSGKDLHSQGYSLTVLTPPEPPKISPGINPTITEGKKIELVCSSRGGSPEPYIKWYKDGGNTPLESSIRKGKEDVTMAVLLLTPSRNDDGSVYRCYVWNRAMPDGTKMENAVTLNVNYFPRVEVGPENPMRVERDGTATLQCNVDAKPKVTNVRWMRNGRFVSTAFSHTLQRVSVMDAGKYTCSADNGLGQTGEAEILLDVLFPPQVVIETAPGMARHREAEEGESLMVKCNVTANPPPFNTEWLREGHPGFRQSGEILRLSSVSAESAGTYICRAANVLTPYGQPKRRSERVGNATVTLLVRHKPGLAHISPERPIAAEGTGVTLTCSANPPGWPAPQYRWWKDSDSSSSPQNVLATGAKYTIPSAHLGSEGRYHCQATNEMGQGEPNSVVLQVHQPPRIVAKLQAHLTRKAGEKDFSVRCGAQGKPKPSVKWLKDGKEIMPNQEMFDVINDESDGRNSLFTVQSTLRFVGKDRPDGNQLVAGDSGFYTCAFENEVKRMESGMRFRIEHEPFILHQYNKVAYDLHETAEVVCRVQAYPRPEFQWSLVGNSAPLTTSSGVDGHYDISTTTEINDVYVSVLRINKVEESDYGEYTCRIANNIGYLKAGIRLQEKSHPDPPTKLTAMRMGHNFVTLGWTPGFDGGIHNVKYFVYYKQVGGGNSNNCVAPTVSYQYPKSSEENVPEFDCQSNNPCNITGLEQHHTYRFKVVTYNAKGPSNASDELIASTKVDRIPAPQRVTYDPESHALSINVAATCLMLLGQVEVTNRDDDSDWRFVETLPIAFSGGGATRSEATIFSLVARAKTHDYKASGRSLGSDDDDLLLEANTQQSSEPRVRVKLCLKSSPEICGDYTEAEIGPSFVKEASAIATPTLIAIIVSCVVFILFVSLLLMFCRCKKNHNKKQQSKDYEMETSVRPSIVQQPPPPYYPATGLENKALEHSMDLALDDPSKNPVYAQQNGYGYHNGPQIPHNGGDWVNVGYNENSYSNSNNGGSVNSQDSLWQMKMASANNANNDQHHIHLERQTSYGYDPLTHGGYGAVDDYVSYPHLTSNTPDHDYGSRTSNNPSRNEYVSDPYGPVHKQKKHLTPHLESPYRDVSGLPDPYMENVDMEEPKPQHMSLSFDESLESGYSTPNSRNRRIIREIIV